MSKLGHNNGPAFGPGFKWRKHCWQKARADLLPTLPIEILRGRVKRARQLGLDYTTYASVRAASGRDVIGFLFSSNALRAYRNSPEMPADRRKSLAAIERCKNVTLASAPLDPDAFLRANPEARLICVKAPDALGSWGQSRRIILETICAQKLPADGVLLIGDAELEREWASAGHLAGYVPAARYFGAQSV